MRSRAAAAVAVIAAIGWCGVAAADEVETTWRGWTALGRPAVASAGSDRGQALAARGDRVLFGNGPSFAATDGNRTVVGQAPISGWSGFPGPPPRPVILPSGRLVLTGRCQVATSDDLGAHWTAASIPAAACPAGNTAPAFVDDRHGIIVTGSAQVGYGIVIPRATQTGPGVVATEDGGRTWSTVRLPENAPASRAVPRTSDPGPPGPQPRVVPQWVAAPGDGAYVRAVLVREGESAFGVSTVLIERSVDGGRTWTAAQLPVKSAASFPDDGAVTPPEGGPGDSLLFAVDGTLVVADADLANARRVTTPGSAPRAVCDAQRRCLVGYDDPTRAGERIAATFDGTAFGSPRPGLPLQAVATGDGTVVGLRTSGSGTTVRSRDLGGSYDDLPLIDDGEWLRAPPPQLARRVGERIDLTLDGVDWRSISHPPSASPLVAVHLAPGGAIGLAEDGRVWRQHDGRWTSWDASALEPSAVATSGAAELVAGFAGLLRRTRAGTRRVVQVAEDGTVRIGGRRVAWVPAAAEWSLAARGPLVLAWTRVGDEGRRMTDLGGLLRSTDGGRTFRRIASARSTDALQIVDARTVYRTDRSGLYVSHDGGRRFRLRNRLDLLADGVDEGGLAFSTPRSGVVGRSVTRDGGRSLTPVPFVPGGERLLGAHGAAVLESGPFQVPMAARHLLDTAVRPRMTLRLRSRSRWGRGVVAAEVSGTLSDAPAGTVVDLVAAPTRSGIRRHQAIDTLVTDERGRFSGSVQLRTERDRLLQAWFPGVVEGDRTVLGARSRWLAVPR